VTAAQTTSATGTTLVPSTEELIARVQEIAPTLAANAAEGERQRRLTDSSVEAMTSAGLFKVSIPRRYGGYGANVRTFLDVNAAVGEADGGAGWVFFILNGGAWLAGLFAGRAQDEVFGTTTDPKVAAVLTPSAETRRVEGGWRVSGKWYFASGSLHSTWAVLGVPITDESGQVVDQGLVLVPRADFTIEDTWYVAGMRSTGSNCIVVEDAYVPEHRLLSVSRAIEGEYPTEHRNEPAYRGAFVPTLSIILTGTQIGLGRAALKLVTEKAATRSITYTSFERQADSVGFQLQLAEAAQKIDTAVLHAQRAAADIDEAAERDIRLDLRTRARVRADTGYAVEHITGAIDTLLYAHGAGGFADASPLQRIWRDSNVAARHAVVGTQVAKEVYGKALLGLEPAITPLI
jgi:alkylation response protein AidB-like acyl-CoA dehydrogenase